MTTRVTGKFAVFFDTKSHGGDNFQFKASGFNPYMQDLFDCVVAGPSQTFTVWRKIYLNYAWMNDRNGQYPGCTSSISQEYHGVHHINNGNFDRIKNIYDDCFIEIESSTRFSNTNYELAIGWWEFVSYGDQTQFRPPMPDHVMLLGVDHVNQYITDYCGGLTGISTPYYWWDFPDNAYYNYCALGYINDIHIQDPYYGLYLDRKWQHDVLKHILTHSAHELGHCLASRSNPMHTDYNYGLMRWADPIRDNRSYFHEGHINDLRSSLPHFDNNQY